ncbi:unnamed protein product [Euphydryas editha]|uniref:Serpin domain-containing protein n=1 Tax=Euphydryas editha TaxID=104508 RepID=A0AAU9UG94_EUPED|nr:unnamed protein product [Euphydryas editha]
MARLTFFLIFVSIPSLFAQCTVEKAEPFFRRAVYEFSTNLLTRVAQENENHFVTSTLSVWSLLASVSVGATDSTLAELKQVLNLKNNKCFNNKYLQIANSIKSDNNTEVVLEKTSQIYVDDSLPILKPFKTKLLKAGSKFEALSFRDTDRAAQTINDYVSIVTHETIDEIVSPGDLEDVLMIMLDAIYFKGIWKSQFSYENTKQSEFHNERGTQIGNVNLMYMYNSFKMVAIDNINATVLEIEYGNDNRYSMFIFLPFYHVSLYSVIENLKVISLSTINRLFEEIEERPLTVQIPRFKITSDISNLKELLIDMGLKSMFDSNSASFSLISNYPLYVSNFIQKADIEVTEEGTVASAVTEAGYTFRTIPEEFIANRPFVFMIVDKKFDVPLFTGAYSKPSLF